MEVQFDDLITVGIIYVLLLCKSYSEHVAILRLALWPRLGDTAASNILRQGEVFSASSCCQDRPERSHPRAYLRFHFGSRYFNFLTSTWVVMFVIK
jgi:hypothetical protein